MHATFWGNWRDIIFGVRQVFCEFIVMGLRVVSLCGWVFEILKNSANKKSLNFLRLFLLG